MKKTFFKLCTTIMAILMLVAIIPMAASAQDADSGANSASVVFVIDDTRSMQTNDPQKLTAVAVEKYIDNLNEASNTGNKVGIVTFSKKVLKSKDLVNVDNASGKDEVKNYIQKNVTQDGAYTNCVVGIKQAVTMLDKDNGSNKAIILVTDGEYDFDTKNGSASSQLESAETSLAKQLEIAQQNGIKIYTIKIDGKGEANDGKVDFENITSTTGGKHFLAKTAEEVNHDIKDIQNDLLNLIGNNEEVEFAKGKETQLRFTIPSGVVYAVIQIDHVAPIEIRNFVYDGSDKYVDYTESEGTGYTNVRMSNPASGDVVMTVYSTANQTSKISFVYASKMAVDAKLDSSLVTTKEEVSLEATVYNEGKVYDNTDESIAVEAILKDSTGTGVATYPLHYSKSLKIFHTSEIIETAGDYTLTFIVAGTDVTSEPMALTVEKAPVSPIVWVLIALGVIIAIVVIALLLKKFVLPAPKPMPFGKIQYSYTNFQTGYSESFLLWTLDGMSDKKTKSVSVYKLMNNNPELSMLEGIIFTATGDQKAPKLQITNNSGCRVTVNSMTVGPNPMTVEMDSIIEINVDDPQIVIDAKRI